MTRAQTFFNCFKKDFLITSLNEFINHLLSFLILDNESFVALFENESRLVGQLVGLGLQLPFEVLLPAAVVLETHVIERPENVFYLLKSETFNNLRVARDTVKSGVQATRQRRA